MTGLDAVLSIDGASPLDGACEEQHAHRHLRGRWNGGPIVGVAIADARPGTLAMCDT
jgi:hypothetical protein